MTAYPWSVTLFQFIASIYSGSVPADLFLFEGDALQAVSEGERQTLAGALGREWRDNESRRVTRSVFTGPENGFVCVFFDGEQVGSKGSKVRLEVETPLTQLRINGRSVAEHQGSRWFRVKRDGSRGSEIRQILVGPENAPELYARPWAEPIQPEIRSRPSALALNLERAAA